MTQDTDGYTLIRLSTATVAAIVAGLGGLGSGFMVFYNSVCLPQVEYLKVAKSTLETRLEQVTTATQANTAAIVQLEQELERFNKGK